MAKKLTKGQKKFRALEKELEGLEGKYEKKYWALGDEINKLREKADDLEREQSDLDDEKNEEEEKLQEKIHNSKADLLAPFIKAFNASTKPLTVYKKVYVEGCGDECIAVLQVAAKTKRIMSHEEVDEDDLRTLHTHKLRVAKAKVISITVIETGEKIKRARARHDSDFIYHVGKIATPDAFDDDHAVQCSSGLHGYLSLEAAKDHN